MALKRQHIDIDNGILKKCIFISPKQTPVTFATGVVDTGGAPCEFSKKIESVVMGFSRAGGKLIHEKNQKQEFS